jgi:hypothetical protein
VTLLKWSPGFVANRLIAALRSHGMGLAEAHRMASQFVEGQRVCILFESQSKAQEFAGEAVHLGVETHVDPAFAVAS